MQKAVVLNSGGLDSSVVMAYTVERMKLTPAALFSNYGQRSLDKELDAFIRICDHYDVRDRLVVDQTYLRVIGGSSLVDKSMSVPVRSEHGELTSLYVPFRNANILAVAVSWAEVLGVQHIVTGVSYFSSSCARDCKQEFIDAFAQAANLGTRDETRIKIISPLAKQNKSTAIKLGLQLQAPMWASWSCAKNVEVPCGRCEPCAARRAAFDELHQVDPAAYAGSAGH